MMTATNIQYEPADRVQGLSAGGIGAIFLLAQKIDLIKEIDRNLHLLKVHQPYHESDHVLNIAFNIVAGGKRIEHLELRRNDEVYLNALGAQRIPDPTTAGDFCRRFSEPDVMTLMDAINQARLRVWAQQPPEFFSARLSLSNPTEGLVDALIIQIESDLSEPINHRASLWDQAEACRRQHETECAETGDLQSLKLPGLGQQDQRRSVDDSPRRHGQSHP